MTTMVHITPKSGNAKTGPIPVTTTSENSCPDACPMKAGKGCYAKSGPLALHWRKVSEGERGGAWADLTAFVAGLPDGQLWRHNQAGDLPHNNGLISHVALGELVAANAGRRGFTYTHHDVTGEYHAEHNRAAIADANANGFTINLSGNNAEHADTLADLGIGPVVSMLPLDYERRNAKGQWTETPEEYRARVAELPPLETPEGRRMAVCPAAYRDTSCSECKLCQRTERKVIVGFPAHGTQKKAASALAAIAVAVA